MVNGLGAQIPFVFMYLDDILVASSSEKGHLRNLFMRLDQYGLIINPAKCLFGLSSIHFLGHLINKDGAAPLLKVEADFCFLLSAFTQLGRSWNS